ncbi:IS256 family transposase [Kitasatospora herbaricolor]|uniref:IS256 family transposase n=1 Tax=Kitasatospora herbaricolor TaxID=68217 RepID=UPI0039A5FF7D
MIASVEAVEEVRPVELSADLLDDQLIGQLVDRARARGLQLTGEGGLLQQLTKRVLESALEGEITDHLGYEKHDPAGAGSGNSRNGIRSKTVLTEVGPVEIDVPRDREGSFEPQIVKKRQRRLTGVDEMVLSLSARGLTHGDISAHLAEVYGASVSKSTISTITDKVMDGMSDWQNRPLDPVYPVIFIDCVHVKVRDGQVANRPIYVALAVTVDGTRDILGLWACDGGEGAKYWLQVLTEIRNRGVEDVCMVVCDGLKGLPDAIGTVWPQAITQTCVVHLMRASFRYAARQDWAEFVPFLQFDTEIRRIVCTTNAIESVNARIRKAVRARGHFPNEQAALKCVCMAVMSLDPTGAGRKRWTMRWKPALQAFDIAFGGRLSVGRR